MPYIFKGRLCGLICEECPEPLAGMKIRLYRSRPGQNVAALAVADPKDTFALLTDEMIKQRESLLLAEAETDDEGNFTITLGDNTGYKGEAFEVDVYCASVPRQKLGPKPPPPRQFTITTLQPLWRQREQDFLAVWEYCLASRIWCGLRALFGAWVICGQVTTCDKHEPVPNVKVSAIDADWITDDPLGSAITDGAGKFRIDYATADFHKTFLSPWINWETPFPPFDSGPDIYFHIETISGPAVTLLNETRPRGQQADRRNRGHCFCVDLCVDPGQIVVTDPEHTPHWQKVDDFNIHPAAPSPASAFSLEGYAGGPGNSYVFGGGIPLRGNCPLKNAAAPAHALEYRFLIGEWGWSGGGDGTAGVMPTIPPASLHPVTQIYATEVGWIFYDDGVNSFQSVSVWIDSTDVNADGWITLFNKAVTVPMADGTTAVFHVNESNFLRFIDLIVLNSNAITAVHPVRLPGGLPKSDAGRSLTLVEQEPIRRYSLRFEARDSVSHAAVANDTLSALVIDNSDVQVALDLEELRVNACNPVSSAVHILYTVDHPHLRYFKVTISNNGGITHNAPPLPNGAFTPPPPPANIFFRGAAGGPHLPTNNGGFAVNVAGDAPCAYRVRLEWGVRRYHEQGTPYSTELLYCK